MGAVGAVLVGGRGSRIGGHKETVEVDGRPLGQWAVSTLVRAGLHPVFAVGSPPGWCPEGALPVADLAGSRGPLWGLYAALRAAGSRPLVMAPCDMPALAPSTLARVAGWCAAGQVVSARVGGRAVPVLSGWPSGSLEHVANRCAGGSRRADAALVGRPVRWFDLPSQEAIEVDGSGDLHALPSLCGTAWRW